MPRHLSARERKIFEEASWKDFEKRLNQEGITLKLAKEGTSGRISGVAFQTGTRRFVTGKELGDTYTSRNLTLRFGLTPEQFEKLLIDKEKRQSEGQRGETTSGKVPLLPAAPKQENETATATRIITGPNEASETKKDLAKIEEAIRKLTPKRSRIQRR